MKRRYDCSIHGSFTADGKTSLCPRCLDAERKGQTDFEPIDRAITDLKTEQQEMAQMEVDMRNGWPVPEGIKHDQDKPDLSLLPKEALEAMAFAFQYGEKKYGRHNFRAGMDWHRPLAAALRHITAFNDGEDLDSESGVSHLGHALAAISMLIVYQTKKVGKDTRAK